MSKISGKLLLCNKCKTYCSNKKPHHKYQFCSFMQCENAPCFNSWYICTKHGLRFSTRSTTRFNSHFATCNVSTTTDSTTHHSFESSEDSLPIWSDTFISNDSNNNDFEIIIERNLKSSKSMKHGVENADCSATEIPYSYIKEPSSQIYFKNEQACKGDGICCLVAGAFAQDTKTKTKASKEESDLHIDISILLNRLSESDQYLFSSIVNRLTRTDMFKTTRPPLNYADICKFYTKSKQSISVNIPSPKTVEVDNHSCVSIESIIDHFLAFGVQFNFINSENSVVDPFVNMSITQTKEARDIYDKVCKQHPDLANSNLPLILYVIIWSDDFEPNQTRKNRNSIWLKTVSICPPTSLKTSSLYTFPIALGRKGQCHDIVNEFFNKELYNMKKTTMRFSKIHNDFVPTVVEPLIISADRPERSSINHILGHTGNSSKRWMFSELISRKTLPSCTTCRDTRIESIRNVSNHANTNIHCLNCCDWEMSTERNKCSFPAPPNYPSKKHPNSPPNPIHRDILDPTLANNQLYPVRITYEHLITASGFAFWNYIHDYWTKTEFRSYLKLVSVCGSTIEKLINHADDSKSSLPISHDFLTYLPFPPMWNSEIRLEQCIDTPMHLLFQGVVKTVINETQAFLKFHSLWTTFGKHANEMMEQISNLKCDFCKVEKFNGDNDFTTGGWIAETYVGFSRIFSFLLIPVVKLLNNDSIAKYEFLAMINCLQMMIAQIFGEDVDIENSTNYIKEFLSSCHQFHSCFYEASNGSKIFWNCSNFLSLLNLPRQIHQFGPLRLHWEGIHEKFIQCVKPMLKNMRSTTSFLNTRLQQIHNNCVIENIFRADIPGSKRKNYMKFRNIHLYKSMEELSDNINVGKCIMAVSISHYSTEEISIGGLVRDQEDFLYVPIQCIDSHGLFLNHIWFTPLRLEVNATFRYSNIEHIMNVVVDFLLLYPAQEDHSNIYVYSTMSKSWKIRDQYGDMAIPSMNI